MTPEENALFEKILQNANRDIAKLHSMGISDYAIVTFLIRVREGQSHERALRGLLQDRRSLNADQRQLIRKILCDLPGIAGVNPR
jgi:hypothetical protein